ncbi:Hypothetical protein PHPALM_38039 [Phytophthora palmivora]|uniref:Uncharacterized protein n=1 Tax=Phytophthora palmivora TaxID=4796 RepID=A0A2P4WVX8_9STRA|nr:Hypothetical protein PHPALM_38039 [Phytophthora palmivora]
MGAHAAVENLPPLRVYDQGALKAHRVEGIARSKFAERKKRLAREGRTMVTRKSAAMEHEKSRGGARDKGSDDRWEKQALREIFGIDPESSSEESTHVGEVLCTIDSADDEQISSGSDSDYEEKASIPHASSGIGDNMAEKADSDGEETEVLETASNEDSSYGDEERMDDEPGGGDDGEASDLTDITEPPKFHRSYDLRTKRVVPSWFYGFKSTFDAWEAFHEAFDDFQAETFQQFSKRTNNGVYTLPAL